MNENPGLNTETDEIIQMAAFPIADTEVACFNRFVTILVLGMIGLSNPSFYIRLFPILDFGRDMINKHSTLSKVHSSHSAHTMGGHQSQRNKGTCDDLL